MAQPKSSATPLPSPPFIQADGVANLRDIGGYPVAGQSGKIIRRGLVFRSSDPGQITDHGAEVLQGLGLTHVYDLRSNAEIQRARSAEGWDTPREFGAVRVFAPVFTDQDYSPEALALRLKHYAEGTEGFVWAYASILAAASDPTNEYSPFLNIFQHMASSSPTPLLIHCKGGKDRTGVICALLLSLCGVSDDLVAHEYALTELGLQERQEQFVQYIMQQNEAFKDNEQAARNMISSRKDTMLATLAMIRKTYGSVEGYVLDRCGLSPKSLEQIRVNFVVDVDPLKDQVPVDWVTHTAIMTTHGMK